MRILVNAGVLKSSGVCQVGRSFLHECLNFPEHEYHVFVSATMQEILKSERFPDNFKFYLFPLHPLYSIFTHASFSCLRQYHRLEKEIDPDCIFTVFGPAWWKSRAPALVGYASPHFVFEDSPYFRDITLLRRLQLKFEKLLFYLALRRETQYYVVENEITKERLSRFLSRPLDHIFVASNTYSDVYAGFKPGAQILPDRKPNEIRLFIPALTQPHKNQTILNGVIPILKKKDPARQYTFITTLPEEAYSRLFAEDVRPFILNLGRILPQTCPQVYLESDFLFLPTLLECFSASYPEAMKMERPILTSNLPFATDTCRNAALYFDPVDPADIAEKVIRLASDPALQAELVSNGTKRLNDFMDASARAKTILSILQQIRRP